LYLVSRDGALRPLHARSPHSNGATEATRVTWRLAFGRFQSRCKAQCIRLGRRSVIKDAPSSMERMKKRLVPTRIRSIDAAGGQVARGHFSTRCEDVRTWSSGPTHVPRGSCLRVERLSVSPGSGLGRKALLPQAR